MLYLIFAESAIFDISSGELLHTFTKPGQISSQHSRWSVALDGNFALIGEYLDPLGQQKNSGQSKSSAYLFDTRSGELLHKLTAPDAADWDWFGSSVSISENFALIGAYGDDDNGERSGSAYLFDTRSGDFLQKLTAPDGVSEDGFGIVALDGETALVGAIGSGAPYKHLEGAVYSFKLTDDSQEEQPQSVPEPASLLGLFTLSGLGMSLLLNRKVND
ncbi:MAG: PEP-CTERM sorting domain-containing protein [Spirulina sp. SIO3F2]|nr:PEP-CTERM sorting domain-containing protein [Spirulina sp. SIO3F2]